MKRSHLSFCILWLCIPAADLFSAETPAARIAQLPLAFEASDREAGWYIARAPGYVLKVSARENVLTFSEPASGKTIRLRTTFPATSSRKLAVHALEPLASRTNYFIGGSSRDWRTDVTNYGKVRVDGLFRGVDLVFYGTGRQLEYDFVAHSGADPDSIGFDIDGADRLHMDDGSGDLVLSAAGADVRWKAPRVYQIVNGDRRPVSARFRLSGRHVRFQVDDYDHGKDLVIDPVLSYSSFLGGSSNESARAIATDSAGNVYVAGATNSSALAVTAGAFQTRFGGQTTSDISGDAFVAKFSASGALIYLTFLGGQSDDFASSLAVDPAGNAYVVGMTNSANFPTTAGAYQKSFAGFGGNTCERLGDAFVTKLNPSGSQLIYSTYLGGRQDDLATGVAIDASGNAYVTGSTLSQDFPITSGAYQTSFRGSGGQQGRPSCGGASLANTGDAFVTKFDPTGSKLIFSTYLGGTLDDFAAAIAVDAQQNVYVGGSTLSRDFPVTSGSLRGVFGGTDPQNVFWNFGDAFVAKLNASGAALIYASYLGGSGDDVITGMFPAADGTLWMTGGTTSVDFPTTNGAVQNRYAGYISVPFLIEQSVGDAFVAHMNSTGAALLYSSYLGGSQNDMGESIAVDNSGLVYVVGFTDSPDFPTADALQKQLAGDGGAGPYFFTGDGFAAVIDPSQGRLLYSSYFGGSLDDQLFALALDGQGGLWATGGTLSTDLPVTSSAAQKAFGGSFGSHQWLGDAVVVHFTALAPAGPAIGAVVNGASFVGGIAPGELATVFGTNLTTSSGIHLAPSVPLPPNLLSVSVNVNGSPAPLFGIANVNGQQQINFQVPWELSAPSNATISVTSDNVTGASITVPAVAAQPAVFGYVVNGITFGAITHADYQLADTANPATAAETLLIYCTGLGEVDSARRWRRWQRAAHHCDADGNNRWCHRSGGL